MELTQLQMNIADALPETELRFYEPLSIHTSFRVGGPAEVMAFPKSTEELSQILKFAREHDIDCALLGAGTNVLAPDEGMKGLVICLKACLSGMEVLPDSCVRFAAGVTMSRGALFAANNGLSGMEFAHGIPGTVGGGVYMNAGAYGGEIGGICVSVDVMDRSGCISCRSAEDMHFSYRYSALQESEEIAVSAVFRLHSAPVEEIKQTMRDLQARRAASQPLDYPSAGSAFKRPQNGYAAALIEQAGLKGFRVGNAAISGKHAGFAVNLGRASSADVRELLRQVSDRVYLHSGIRLEPEIRIWK